MKRFSIRHATVSYEKSDDPLDHRFKSDENGGASNHFREESLTYTSFNASRYMPT